jgi:hypothetical protein
MVDIARDVFTALTIDSLLRIKFEQVLSAAAVGLFLSDDLAPIFCDDCGFLDKFGGKSPRPCAPRFTFTFLCNSRFMIVLSYLDGNSGWQ